MPVRFLCPACHKLLAIASRKIGSQVACPKCQAQIIVPDPHEPSTHATLDPLKPGESDDDDLDPPARQIAVPPPPPSAKGTEDSSTPMMVTPAAIREAPRQTASSKPDVPAAAADTITISRRTLYIQAALLAVVALLAFITGYVIGAAGRTP